MDGATFLVQRDKMEEFNKICKDWMAMTRYELEFQEYKSMWFSNVNNYIALKPDGTVKKKGDTFLTDYEIFKDKSNRVIPLALEDYFIKGTDPETFIKNHKNIFDFCARGKVNKSFYISSIDRKENDEENFEKLIRYYVAKDGTKLLKRKRANVLTRAAKQSEIVAGSRYQMLLNNPDEENLEEHLKNIDYQWYIDKVLEVIYKIESGKPKAKRPVVNPDQTSLF